MADGGGRCRCWEESLSHAGEIAAFATALCWTVTALAFESAGRWIGAVSLNLIRLVLGLVFLTIVCWVRTGMLMPLNATVHAWIWLAISGVVGLTLGDLCLFRAFVLIGARLSMLVMALVPPITAVLGWALMGETLVVRELVGMGLTVAGVGWVVSERKHRYTVTGWWPKVAVAVRNRAAMGRVTLGAFFGPFLGVSLSLLAVQLTQAGVAATLMSLVPVLIIPPAVLLFKENVSVRAVVGSVVAVAGCSLLFL